MAALKVVINRSKIKSVFDIEENLYSVYEVRFDSEPRVVR